ncbi:MAG: hypothetical protein COW00_14630 [Bdellovibrio sp. CG12_big_fil_rev_8_21_14_0_65_39_13]|nr:MAG: hypothetical protein COW78_15010 [Bdellovibrio sp. CG22_combo_CG10-13_8_21_14_all_39_27]PIQ58634.1 MAG: hypothetical protein COW00_14630 [Bdellovibrio sp. CG12_big_fil_rev_8_21_14_0_65_39_13]PIR33388.1 MAG: hypothetical protein COV37_16540 [Bdellovibrio sp. CG11_big_fil_rev_8_21_14_0_20_39_38]
MTSVLRELLLIESIDLGQLVEEYRSFFLALLPSVFILAILIEYLDQLEPFVLVKRAFISILILTSVTTFYHQSIETSMEVADEILSSQKQGNILLMDMFDGVNHWDMIKYEDQFKKFYKDRNPLTGTFAFLKYHLFDSFVNDAFTVTIYFITKLCFIILKVVYSLVYYLGYGLIGIPCLLYLFPTMGSVLRGATLSYVWCLIVPHILVFIISMIGTEINKGYVSGQIIGGSMMGTSLLFILTLFIAFTPLIGTMILSGSGASSAGGIIASMGANYVMNLPKNGFRSGVSLLSGAPMSPKMKLAKEAIGGSYKLTSKASGAIFSKFRGSGSNKSSILRDANPMQGERVTDMEHVSKFINSVQKDMGASALVSANGKKVRDIRFRLGPTSSNQNLIERDSNAKISKSGKVDKRSEKTTHDHRRGERPSQSNPARNWELHKLRTKR